MDETTSQGQPEPQGDAPAEQDEQAKQFDPDEIESDPARNPDQQGLKDLKGG